LAFYSDSGGKGDPAIAQGKSSSANVGENRNCNPNCFIGFSYEKYFEADTSRKLSIILEAEEHILGLENGRKRYVDEVTSLSKAFAIAIPHEQALVVKDEIAFFRLLNPD